MGLLTGTVIGMLNFRSYSSTILSAFQFVHLSVSGTLFGQLFSRPSEVPLADSVAEWPFTAHLTFSNCTGLRLSELGREIIAISGSDYLKLSGALGSQ